MSSLREEILDALLQYAQLDKCINEDAGIEDAICTPDRPCMFCRTSALLDAARNQTDAISALLSDIEAMQGPCACGIEPCPHFSGFVSGDYDPVDESYSIEWPNLATSAKQLRS
jgi:hypothetical protein